LVITVLKKIVTTLFVRLQIQFSYNLLNNAKVNVLVSLHIATANNSEKFANLLKVMKQKAKVRCQSTKSTPEYTHFNVRLLYLVLNNILML
jgi:hypothetical protein